LKANDQTLTIGFPLGRFSDKWFPKILQAKILDPPKSALPRAEIILDAFLGEGSSGAPVYCFDKLRNKYKVVGLNSILISGNNRGVL